MTKVMKIALSLIILLGIGLAIFLYFYSFPKKIDADRSAVFFYEQEPSSLERTSIHISGTLYRPFLRQHKFVGSIRIDGFDVTKEYDPFDTYVLERKKGINSGNLLYLEPKKHRDFFMAGVIWFDNDFKEISIWWNNKNPHQFIVTADSYNEALMVQQRIREVFGSSFVPRI